MSLYDDIANLPFQPDEEETIKSIIDVAQAFRDQMQQFIVPNPVMATQDEVPLMRFYLRKIEGADILLVEETNFFRQELYRFNPIAPQAPPVVETSSSTRKPRPTKQQKLMALHGVSNPDDLPEHLKGKGLPLSKRKSVDDKSGPPLKIPSDGTGMGSRKTSTNGSNHHTPSALNFKQPLTATAFPQPSGSASSRNGNEDSPLLPQQRSQYDSPYGELPSATLPALGSPYDSAGAGSPVAQTSSLDAALFDSNGRHDSGRQLNSGQYPDTDPGESQTDGNPDGDGAFENMLADLTNQDDSADSQGASSAQAQAMAAAAMERARAAEGMVDPALM